VCEKLFDGDVRGIAVPETGQVLGRTVGKSDLSFFEKDLYRGTDQRFCHRPDIENRVALHGHILFTIHPAKGVVENGVPVTDDEHFSSNDLAAVYIALQLCGKGIQGGGLNSMRLGRCSGIGGHLCQADREGGNDQQYEH